MKIKLKTYDDKFNTAFLDNEIPKNRQQQSKSSLLLHCSNLYQFCIKIKWRKLSLSVSKTM